MAVIHVTPSDSYAVIEAAQPGDEVILAPGTYTFRVYLQQQATAAAAIYIHAQDPSNPPVVDFGSTLVENAPGSYGGGDKGRGCWQVSGGTNITIESIVFKDCRTSTADSAGIRYYEGASITVRNCVFQDNDNGITGGTQSSTALVEYCEFDHNGNANAPSSAPTHNLYIYGGTFTLRYSWVHDPLQGQNFHIRAQTSTLEYNWFARAASYEGDLMTDDDYSGGGSFTQSMVFRGNVVFEGTTQSNNSQIIAMYNDTGASGLTLQTHVLYNTFIGSDSHADFVHVSNADGTPMVTAIEDNVIAGAAAAVHVEDSTHATVSGTNRMTTGSDPTPLTGTVTGADPGFVDAGAEDFHLGMGSTAIGAASSGLMDLPDAEYWENEVVTRMWRARLAVKDIGAFESTTNGTPMGPFGPTDGGTGGGSDASIGSDGSASGGGPDGSMGGVEASVPGEGGASGDGGPNGASPGSSSGCGCRVTDGAGGASALGAIAAIALAFTLRRRRV
jgi:MYXO-CTERM domain-containing protein